MTKKIIVISGTPGTGKTKVARALSKRLKAKLITVNELIKNKKLKYDIDKERKCKIIDVDELQKAVDKTRKNKITIIEGHLCHFLKCNLVVVLRTNPIVLKKRLQARKWSLSKINENIESELIDQITIEALGKHPAKKVMEIDTTDKSAKKTSDTINDILKKPSLNKKYIAGHISWMDKVADKV